MCVCESLSHVWLFAIPWTVALQAPLSMGFSRQEYRSRLPFPSPGALPDPGIEPGSPTLQADFFTTEPPGKQKCLLITYLTYCNPFWEPTWVTHMLMSVWYEIDWQGPFQGSNRHPNHCIFLPFFPWASATIHMHFHSSLSCIVLIILFYYCELYIGRSQA